MNAREGGTSQTTLLQSGLEVRSRLALAVRQLLERGIQGGHRLIEFQPRDRRQILAGRLGDGIGVIIIFVAAERHPGHDPTTHGAAALHVADAIFQDPVEERLPLRLGAPGIGARKLQHRVLDRVQRIILMPQAGLRDLVRLQFHARQKLVERSRSGLRSVVQ